MKSRASGLALVPVIALAIAVAATSACAAEKAGGAAGAGSTESAGQAASGGGSNGGGEIAAKVGDETITTKELDAFLMTTNAKAVQTYYNARRAALDQMIAQRLMDAEAATRGVSREALQQQILSGAPAVGDAEIQAFYDQNKARLQNRALDDQLKGQIRTYLGSQGQQQVVAKFIDDLKKKSGVTVSLEPPRVEVRIAANDPYKGKEGAPVQIVEYSDFQ